MYKPILAVLIAGCCLLNAPAASAKDKQTANAPGNSGKEEAKDADPGHKDADHGNKDEDIKLPPFPADKTVHQSTTLNGHVVKYDATVGSLPVLDEKGKTIGEVMFTAYTVPGADRPVTFALNGGPGASSVYLNLGAIGPKRVQFGAEGNSPSDPADAARQPGTWLDFTDLVFIDPVGTGFSRAHVLRTKRRRVSTTPTATSSTCRASSTTGW